MKLSLNNVFQGNLSREADEVKKKKLVIYLGQYQSR